jgi:hypothetical protein
MTVEDIAALLERVASLPEAAQDEFVASLAAIEAKYGRVYWVSGEERVALERGLASVRERRLVSEDDMAAFWSRHGV